MSLFSWLKGWGVSDPPARPSRPALGLTSLEARDTPAALYSFDTGSGALVVTFDSNVGTGQNAQIQDGEVPLNGSQQRVVFLNGKRTDVPTQLVKSITVIGNDFDNGIDLTEVSTRAFVGLDEKVLLMGGGGKDVIRGSQFSDEIHGGAGDDRLIGRDGNDRMFGEAGVDRLWGQDGKDTLDGGKGDDFLYGDEKNDTLRGGGGADRFDGGPGGADIALDFHRREGDVLLKTTERG